mgnify:CR=1 FL=1
MATPIWNENEQRWTYRVTSYGVTKKFTSRKKGTAGKREVIAKAREFEQGSFGSARSFSEEWNRFLEDVEARSSKCNLDNIKQIGRLYILPNVNQKRTFYSYTLAEFQRILNGCTKQDGSPLSRKSLSNIRGTLTSLINYARIDGATEIPFCSLYVPKFALEKQEKQILLPEQIHAIFEPHDDIFYINLWRLMLVTGMRPGEALGLKWSDVLDNRIIIQRSVNRDSDITPGKNKNARRIIPMNEILSKILADQKEKTAKYKSEWIFCNQSGAMASQNAIYSSIENNKNRLGFTFSPYSLRHTFVSMVKNDIPEQMIKSIVGHSVSMDTFGTYGHEIQGEAEQASAKISMIFNSVI